MHRLALRHESVLAEIEKKSKRSENTLLTLHDRQQKIEQDYTANMAKIEKAAALAERIEEAIAQQHRLSRRIEKVTQDKNDMIRKLERIEETVIETQVALSTRALLPGPGMGDAGRGRESVALGAPGADKATGFPAATRPRQTDTKRPRSPAAPYLQAAAVTALLAVAGAGGWLALEMKNGGLPQFSALVSSDAGPSQTAAADTDIAPPPSVPPQEITEIAAAPEPVQPTPIENMTDEQLLAAMEENPDALAAQLNEIAPVAAPPAPDESVLDEIAPEDAAAEPSAEAQPASFTPPAETAASLPVENAEAQKPAPFDLAAFLAAQKEARPLSARIVPDATLPGVVKDVEKKAFEGLAEAQHDLAAIYTAGHGGVKIDYARAALWFREAALGGVANARYNLGVLYHQGLGVEKDVEKALGWYRAAADLGHAEAQYNLGIAHIEGTGIAYDPALAARYFENAANNGIMEAAFNLGLIHENGLIGRPDSDKALFWYKKASDKGSPEARTALQNLAKSLGMAQDKINRLLQNAENDVKPDPITPGNMDRSGSTKGRTAPPPPPEGADPAGRADAGPSPASGPEVLVAAPMDAPFTERPAMPADLPPGLTDEEKEKRKIMQPQFDTAVVAQIQEQLVRLGLYPGPADGVFTPMTEDAIRSYQDSNDIRRDGRPSQALLVHMLTAGMDDGAAMEEDIYGGEGPGEMGSRE